MTPAKRRSVQEPDRIRPKWKPQERDVWLENFAMCQEILMEATLNRDEGQAQLADDVKEELLTEDVKLAARLAFVAVQEFQCMFLEKVEAPEDTRRKKR
jgi:hypothetical protein